MATPQGQSVPPASAPAPTPSLAPTPTAPPSRPTPGPVAPASRLPYLGTFLKGRTLIEFGRANNDYEIFNVTVSIATQDSIAGMTYDQLTALCVVDLAITRPTFIRMWKTLILKRVQDVYQKEKKIRPENMVSDSSILIPGPLGDLLYSLGQHTSTTNGRVYDIIPPARPADPPDWWTVDPVILASWVGTMSRRLKSQFVIYEFPSMSDYTGRPLCFTTVTPDDQPQRTVKAFSSESTPSDALVRFVNDDLFNPTPYPFNECHLIMVEPLN